MAFGTLQDQNGEIDLLFFDRAWESCKVVITVDEMLALKGSIKAPRDGRQEKPSFVVTSIQDLNRLVRMAAKKAAEAPVKNTGENNDGAGEEKKPSIEEVRREIHIRLAAAAAQSEAVLFSLRDLLAKNPGTNPVYIHVPAESNPEETVIRVSEFFNAGVPEPGNVFESCTAVAEVWTR
jgi:DNA polymerase III alpha subunit